MPVFVALRVLSGLQGTYFHVAGQTILATYFPPVSDETTSKYTSDMDRLNEEQRQSFSSQVQLWDLLLVSLHGQFYLLVLTVRSRTMRCGYCRHVPELARYLMAASWNNRLGSYHVVDFYPLPKNRRPEDQKPS